MTNMIIMVHFPFSEITLKHTFSTIPDVRIISIPLDWSSKTLEAQAKDLKRVLQENGLDYSNIDFFLVESNYGNRSSLEINEALLKHLLSNFRNAKIIAYSNTTESLIKALLADERIKVMNNANNLEVEITDILKKLFSPEKIKSISERIYSSGKLKTEVEDHARKRLSTTSMPAPAPQMAIRQESDFSAQRKSTPPILPMYSTTSNLASASEEKPTTEEEPEIDSHCQPS